MGSRQPPATMNKEEAEDSLPRRFEKLTIQLTPTNEEGKAEAKNKPARVETAAPTEEDSRIQEASYVHIDIITGSNYNISRAINTYMLERFYFDPRRFFNFYDEVFDTPPNLTQMRQVGQLSDQYYELWKVKSDFSLEHFFQYLHRKVGRHQFEIRVCLISDNEHSIYRQTF